MRRILLGVVIKLIKQNQKINSLKIYLAINRILNLINEDSMHEKTVAAEHTHFKEIIKNVGIYIVSFLKLLPAVG